MALQENSSQNVAEIVHRFGSTSGLFATTTLNTDGEITVEKYYDDSGTLLITGNSLKGSYIMLDDFEDYTTYSWTETGDGALSTTSGGWMDGTLDVTTNTYTYSTGSSIVSTTEAWDGTTSLAGDLSDWIGDDCDEGYAYVFLKFSDFANVTSVEFRIGSAADTYRSVTLTSGSDYYANNEWFGLWFDLSAGSSENSPDGENIDYTALVFTFASGTAKTIQIKNLFLVAESTTSLTGEDFLDFYLDSDVYAIEGKTINQYCLYDSEQNIIDIKVIDGY